MLPKSNVTLGDGRRRRKSLIISWDRTEDEPASFRFSSSSSSFTHPYIHIPTTLVMFSAQLTRATRGAIVLQRTFSHVPTISHHFTAPETTSQKQGLECVR